jgi:hypothetical protein
MVTFKIKEKLRKSKVILSHIENGLKEVKAIREGKLKPLSTSDLWKD